MLPNEILCQIGRSYPDAWKNIEIFRQSQGKDLPQWPSWCFLPMAAWYAIVSAHHSQDRLDLDIVQDVSQLAALGTWRYSQGIYRFSPEFYTAMIDTIPNGELPVDIFYNLPEWCVYIESPGINWFNSEIYGFWCHLEWDANTKRHELRFLLNTASGLITVAMHLGKWTLTESIDRMISESKKQAAQAEINFESTQDMQQDMALNLHGLVSLVLYLCSEEPEIDDARIPGSRPSYPKPQRTKKGLRIFPAEKPRIWMVGEKLALQLKSALSLNEPNGRKMTPHLRRAHWHGFWTGPLSGERKFTYKWLPPSFVGAEKLNK